MDKKMFELWLAANAMIATRDLLGQSDPPVGEWIRLRNAVEALEPDAKEATRKEAEDRCIRLSRFVR